MHMYTCMPTCTHQPTGMQGDLRAPCLKGTAPQHVYVCRGCGGSRVEPGGPGVPMALVLEVP